MAPVYADHPFSPIPTPIFLAKSKDANMTPDIFDDMASEMALVHNMIILGINSIYLQAPHITPADEKSFCKYITCWYDVVDGHHAGEEDILFPAVESMTGVKGIMDTNKGQHKAFHDGMDKLKAYADAVLAGKEKYEGSKVVGLIDDFGAVLTQHLADEIPTILNLRQFGDKMAGLPKVMSDEGAKAMKDIGTPGMVFAFANLNVHYENDTWPAFPPAPAPVKVLMRTVFWWMYADSRKFGAVDRAGNLRHLYAVPESS